MKLYRCRDERLASFSRRARVVEINLLSIFDLSAYTQALYLKMHMLVTRERAGNTRETGKRRKSRLLETRAPRRVFLRSFSMRAPPPQLYRFTRIFPTSHLSDFCSWRLALPAALI